MKDELKDLVVNFGLMISGVFARVKFDTEVKYTISQIIAIIGVGIAIMVLIDETELSKFRGMCVVFAYGLAAPSLLRAIIRGLKKSEDKAADKLSDKIDKLT